ncbi:DUF2922 domain-containing protein [Alkalibacter mobilis]|uniref:DUF2922 domain-containing protein n=1 Tax=Alkalibacter mobilis TaxID=2787712 RepID=UPI00189EB7AF|nr:DUF2922 domain-containing protein [Alkalibacter mobilis]MBF7096136.1 DUF2922 domain-containing protein [Alkalibacter mobilis]
MPEFKLDMNFKRADGYNSKLSVADARTDLTGVEAAAFMDLVISKQIFHPSGSPIAEKVSAQLISTDVTELTL